MFAKCEKMSKARKEGLRFLDASPGSVYRHSWRDEEGRDELFLPLHF